MRSGVGTINIDTAQFADDLIGNRDGNTVRVPMNMLAAAIDAEIPGPNYRTRGELFADLNWPELTRGSVWGDSNESFRGQYRKTGAPESGDWVWFAEMPQTSLTTAQLNEIILKVEAGIVTGVVVGTWFAADGAFPVTRPDGSSIVKGDTWRVTGEGTINGEQFAVGDYLQAIKAGGGGTFAGNWSRAGLGQIAADRAAAEKARNEAVAVGIQTRTVADRAALRALSPTGFPAYLKETGRQGAYVWDASIPRDRINADPDEQHYIAPSASGAGAWVRQNLSAAEMAAIRRAARQPFMGWPMPEDRANPDRAADPRFGERYNLRSHSEDPSQSSYNKAGTAVDADALLYRGVNLHKVRVTGGYTAQLGDLRNTDTAMPLVPGRLYIASVLAAAARPVPDAAGLDEPNSFMWMRAVANATTWGHGAKLLFPHPRRVWSVFRAGAAANTVKTLSNPTLPWDDQAESTAGLRWLQSNFGLGASVQVPEVWMGGFQIEEAPNQTEKMGIVTLGTSIDVSGNGGNGMHWTQARGWARWLEGLLCAPIFQGSIGGQFAAQIDARFDTDIAPLRNHAKYIVLCCNVNDFVVGFDSAAYRATWASIYSKARAAGWSESEIIVMTIQPRSVYNYANGATDMAAENAHIKATYRNVIDRGLIMRDAIDQGLLAADWETDGIHQSGLAQRALAFMIYNQYRHLFAFDNVPGPYQRTGAAGSVNSFGRPAMLGRYRASRVASASPTAIRNSDAGSAPVIVLEAATSGAVIYQLPVPNFAWDNEGKRDNTDVQVQQIVNQTTGGHAISVRYYKQTDSGGNVTTVGPVIGPIPAGECWTVATDGASAWRVQ